MKLKWERNSRALSLVAQGKIKEEDILPRSRTDEFPPEAATVRMQKLSDKAPHVVVHIRGKSKRRKLWNNHAYECASTCRVTLANHWNGSDFGMSSSGELDEDYDWQDVHNVVAEVKEAMGITNEKEKDNEKEGSTEEEVSVEKENSEEEIDGEEGEGEEASDEEKTIPEWLQSNPLKEIKAFEKRGWSS